MRYVLLDPRNGPIGPTPPEESAIAPTIDDAKWLMRAQLLGFDPPKWMEVYDADAWDGTSYGDLVGQLHSGPNGGITFERA